MQVLRLRSPLATSAQDDNFFVSRGVLTGVGRDPTLVGPTAGSTRMGHPGFRGSPRLQLQETWGTRGLLLFEELGVKAAVDVVLMRWVAVGVEGVDERVESRGEHDEVAGIGSGGVGVRHACGDEDGLAGSCGLGAIGIAEGEFSLEDVPGFVVGVVEVQRRRAAAAPFVDLEALARGGEGLVGHAVYLSAARG